MTLDQTIPAFSIQPRSFRFALSGKVATVTLDRPERKNPLTFESYRELSDTFDRLRRVPEVKVVVLTHAAREGNVRHALQQIGKLTVVVERAALIRIME